MPLNVDYLQKSMHPRTADTHICKHGTVTIHRMKAGVEKSVSILNGELSLSSGTILLE